MSKVEVLAVRAVKEYLDKSRRLVAYIPEYDREFSWDGNVYLFDEEKEFYEPRKKDSMRAKIPTQVKGKFVKKFSGDVTKKNYSKEHLFNYLNDGGIVLFFVEMLEPANRKIFYSIQLPYDLKKAIEKNKKTDSVNIVHNSIENISPKEFENILLDFSENKKMQFSVYDKNLSIDNAERLVVKKSFYTGDVLSNYLNKEAFLYGYEKNGGSIPLIIEKGWIEEVTESRSAIVRTENQCYFSKINIHHKSNGKGFVTYDGIVKIFGELEQVKISICDHLTLDEGIKGRDFLLDIYSLGFYYINDERKDVQIEEDIKEIETLERQTVFFKKIKEVLIYLQISEEISLDRISDNDSRLIYFLYEALIEGREFDFKNYKSSRVFYEVLNKKVILLRLKTSNKTCRFYDHRQLVKDQCRIVSSDDEEQYCICSPYVVLNRSDFSEAVNIDYQDVVSKIQGNEYSDFFDAQLTRCILEMIAAYDICLNAEILECTKKLLDWQMENVGNNVVSQINQYQVLFRQDKLTPREYIQIEKLLQEKTFDRYKLLEFCVYVLLKDKKSAEKILKGEKTRELVDIEIFPIYNLYKGL